MIKKRQTEAELKSKLGKTRENETRNPRASPCKMLGTTWDKAKARVQNKEPSYTKLGLKLSFSLLIIKMIHFFLDKTSTVYYIMA